MEVMAAGRKWRLPRLWQAAALLVAALFTPMRVWAVNLVEVGFPDGILIWSGLMWVLALGTWLLAVWWGGEPRGVTSAVFWFMVAIGSLGTLMRDTPGGVAGMSALALILAIVAYRLRGVPTYQWLTSWAVLFALLTPIGLAGKSMLSRPESQVQPAAAVAVGEFKETPDVLILVFDALGSSTVLERFYDYDSIYLDRFRTAGLGVSDSMTANYNFTHLSLSSFYRMDYPLLEGQSAGDAEWADLLRAIRGDNPLVEAFQSQGYRFLMVESSWSGAQCSRYVDICIRGVWPDTPTATAVRRSLFGALPIPALVEAMAPANLNSIAWLESDLESYLSNDQPEIMFVHLFLPHAPLRLDSNCEYRRDGGLGHMAVVAPVHSASDAEKRKRLYVDQVRCAERVIRGVTELVGDRAI
ncbi:MAG: hypothetical protein ACE5F5_11400, partial [Acidimicrobiia bacterium]